MAFTQILMRRSCPASSFEQLEEVVANHVGHVVYGSRYPGDAVVDAATQHGRLDTHMALKVEVDTEDLPGEGWYITPSGLCRPYDGPIVSAYKGIPPEGLTDAQRNVHFAVLGKQICEAVAADTIWDKGNLGWLPDADSTKKLGVLVARAEGAWHATYTLEQE